ncbi:MAG TPA: AMP-binding protein [Bacteroidales bacterium]|nr:AMP-binding protein [Bacteroidales bacterium]HOH22170.1 AMP-binding protein [Bacteroidales bacterium]HPZ02595.1 AMP-binding protein [Bacteroidales bacterium]HQB74506.1 AMP-binding protein [Bacteroidales bacterium]
MITDPSIEFQPLEQIVAFQEEKLQSALQYLKAHSPFYQNLFKQEQIEIESIKTMEQLQLIPFTEKSALHEHNKDFLCTPKEKIIDYITTSGTSGDPVTFAMSDRDLERLAYNEAISFMGTGSKPGDIFQLMTTIDKRFMAGLAYFLGVRMLGAGIIRVGNGIPELQWDTIRRINPDTLIVVPSFILKIIQYAEENQIDYHQFGVKKAVCIGENLREQDFSLNLLGQKIKEKWDIELYSTYASTEMSTSFTECIAQKGGHLHPELIICELIDNDGNVVKEGEYGELVVTTLGVEAMPLLRYKTGDMCRFHYEPCSCGRNTPRISPIIGRKNQMIKFKGTTLYPYAIFDVLDQISYVENYLVYVSTNEIGTDQLTVKVGTRHQSEEIEKEIKDRFRARLRVAPEVIFESIETIQKIQTPEIKRKPIKFFDERK